MSGGQANIFLLCKTFDLVTKMGREGENIRFLFTTLFQNQKPISNQGPSTAQNTSSRMKSKTTSPIKSVTSSVKKPPLGSSKKNTSRFAQMEKNDC